MVNKKVTLSVDSDIYEQFQNFCKDNDIMLSKRVERIMKEQLIKSVKTQKPISKNLNEFLIGDPNDNI